MSSSSPAALVLLRLAGRDRNMKLSIVSATNAGRYNANAALSCKNSDKSLLSDRNATYAREFRPLPYNRPGPWPVRPFDVVFTPSTPPPLLMAYLSSSLASSEDLSRKHTSPHRCGAMISNLEQDQDKTNARHSFSRSM